jgi:hypothetical protein
MSPEFVLCADVVTVRLAHRRAANVIINLLNRFILPPSESHYQLLPSLNGLRIATTKTNVCLRHTTVETEHTPAYGHHEKLSYSQLVMQVRRDQTTCLTGTFRLRRRDEYEYR